MVLLKGKKMKKYIAVKNLTVLVSMFLAGLLVLANGASAGNTNHDPFMEEKKAKGFSHDYKNPSHFEREKGNVSSKNLGTNHDLFTEEKKAKGFSHHYKKPSQEVTRGSNVFSTNTGPNKGLFSEERSVKGVSEHSQ